MTSMRSFLLAFFIAALPVRAVTITDFVESAEGFSFNFSGSGHLDVLQINVQPQFWLFLGAGGGAGENDFIMDLQFLHTAGAPFAPPTLLSATGQYGTTASSTVAVPHGDALDIYSLQVTVQRGPTDFSWGAFSGSFSALHQETPPTSLPDGGSLIGSFISVAVLLFRFARKQEQSKTFHI